MMNGPASDLTDLINDCTHIGACDGGKPRSYVIDNY